MILNDISSSLMIHNNFVFFEMTNNQNYFHHKSLLHSVNINLMVYFVAVMSVDKTKDL